MTQALISAPQELLKINQHKYGLIEHVTILEHAKQKLVQGRETKGEIIVQIVLFLYLSFHIIQAIAQCKLKFCNVGLSFF